MNADLRTPAPEGLVPGAVHVDPFAALAAFDDSMPVGLALLDRDRVRTRGQVTAVGCCVQDANSARPAFSGGSTKSSRRESRAVLSAPDGKAGFGSFLIENVLSADLSGDVSSPFERDGFQCSIIIPPQDIIAPYGGGF